MGVIRINQNFKIASPRQHATVLLTRDPNGFAPCGPDKNGKFNNHWEKAGWDWWQRDPQGFGRARDHQHAMLRQIFGCAQQTYNLDLPPVEGFSDLVYMADGSISLLDEGGVLRTAFSHFSNPNRIGEELHHIDFFGSQAFKDLGLCKIHATENLNWAFEGNGDCVYDPYRDCFWSGYHNDPSPDKAHEGRGDIRANKQIENFFGVKTHDLANNFPFYHVDTALAPLPRGHIVVFPGGMQPRSYEYLKEEAFGKFNLPPEEYLIEVSAEDADKFACNIRVVGNTVFMPDCSEKLQKQIRSKGYKVMPLDVSAFIAGGGAVHCLTNPINELRIEGGYHLRRELMPLAI